MNLFEAALNISESDAFQICTALKYYITTKRSFATNEQIDDFKRIHRDIENIYLLPTANRIIGNIDLFKTTQENIGC